MGSKGRLSGFVGRRFGEMVFLLCLFLLMGPQGWSRWPAQGADLFADELHNFHTSVSRIDFNPEAQTLEVAIKIFTDDLERSLEGMGSPALRLGSPREAVQADSIIGVYLRHCLGFAVDGETKSFYFLGKEVEFDVTWCYLEVSQVQQLHRLVVKNRILMELFPDQSNLVHIYAADQQKSLLLTAAQDRDGVDF